MAFPLPGIGNAASLALGAAGEHNGTGFGATPTGSSSASTGDTSSGAPVSTQDIFNFNPPASPLNNLLPIAAVALAIFVIARRK